MSKAKSSIRITKLPNGLTVITDTVPTTETMAVGVFVKTGARHEDESINGISHFLEHMLFKGTKKRDAIAITEETEAEGLNVNAFTSNDVTAYHMNGMKDSLPKAVDVLSDMIMNSQFDQKELDTERGAVKEEILQYDDDPTSVLMKNMNKVCFPDDAAGRTILGPAENIDSFTRKQLKDYVREHYNGSNSVLVASGNVDHDELVRMARTKSRGMKKGKPSQTTAPKWVGGDVREEREINQTHFAMRLPTVPDTHPDYYAHMLAGKILGGGMSSRLFKEVREKRGLVYTVSAGASGNKDYGSLTIYGGTSEDKVATMVPVMAAVIKKLSKDATQAELDKVRKQLKTSLAIQQESMTSRRNSAAMSMLFEGKIEPLTDVIAKLDAVTVEDVKRAAATWTTNGPVAVSSYGRVKNVPSYEEISKQLGTPVPGVAAANRNKAKKPPAPPKADRARVAVELKYEEPKAANGPKPRFGMTGS
ncbi:MAG: pitrilysin family protein [Alphaproteobacteria bacterium]